MCTWTRALISVEHSPAWAGTLEAADSIDTLKLADSLELLTLIHVWQRNSWLLIVLVGGDTPSRSQNKIQAVIADFLPRVARLKRSFKRKVHCNRKKQWANKTMRIETTLKTLGFEKKRHVSNAIVIVYTFSTLITQILLDCSKPLVSHMHK